MKKLYRPVGVKEMDLILDTGCRRYPDRLPTQPIFYPVLNQEYAVEIAEKWNTKDISSGFAGYVTEFNIDEKYISNYEVHNVGSSIHEELWIPAEDLSKFNSRIITPIKISYAFFGEKYNCSKYIKHLIELKYLREYNPMDFSCTVQTIWKVINLNYILWLNYSCIESINEQEKCFLLNEIKNILIKNKKWFLSTEEMCFLRSMV